jgi:hypothetical protein
MTSNPFQQKNPVAFLRWWVLGGLVGLSVGAIPYGLPGACLGLLLGLLVVHRILRIHPRLPRARYVDPAEHPTLATRHRVPADAITWAPIQKKNE